jgi:zinc protease
MSRRTLDPRVLLLPLLVGLLLVSPGLDAQTGPPPPLAERPIDFPPFEEFTLDNGLRVVVLPYGSQPVMSARLYTFGGNALVGESRAGLPSLTATVLTRGTERRSAEEIAAAIEGVGGSIGASGGQDFFSVNVVSLVDDMDLAFDLLEDVVLSASFPDDEVELARRQALSSLQAQLGQPGAIASRHFSSVLYGEHPYGRASTPESVGNLTRDDLVDFRDQVLQPNGALLMVVGAVDPSDVLARAERHFGEWEGEPTPIPELPAPPERDQRQVYLVHRPGSSQSVLRIGHLGIQPDEPDYFPLVVMNRVLGGGADARLFQILREERGWTYGAGSSFSRPAFQGTFSASSEVRTEVTDSTVVEILHQLERLRDEPIPDAELDAARNYLAGSFPLRLETADQIGGQLASTLLLGLPVTDVTEYPDRIRSVTAEDVRRAARAHLHPDRVAIVVVGDGTEILETLEAIAPVEIFDVTGEPLLREDVLGARDADPIDASRLEEGVRRYEYYLEDQVMGSAEYRLERDGDEWVATTSVEAQGSLQETELRFGVVDFSPRSLRQTQSQGPIEIAVDLTVSDGRLTGSIDLPPQLGGGQEFDQTLSSGVLLPGMDEYLLALSDLHEGASVTITTFDPTSGEPTRIEATVTRSETLVIGERSHEVWRVEVTGGQVPMVHYVSLDAPHLPIRQEFPGQPIRIDRVEPH